MLTRFTVGVQVRGLTYPDSSIAKPLAESIVVERRRVEDTSVVPDCNVIWALPLETNLQIVVLIQQLLEVFQQVVTFSLGQPVDLLGEHAELVFCQHHLALEVKNDQTTYSEDTLPA